MTSVPKKSPLRCLLMRLCLGVYYVLLVGKASAAVLYAPVIVNDANILQHANHATVASTRQGDVFVV